MYGFAIRVVLGLGDDAGSGEGGGVGDGGGRELGQRLSSTKTGNIGRNLGRI